jgi:hypothetical protein
VSEEQARDPLALGLGSLAAGVGFGGACLSASQVVTAILRDYVSPNDATDPGSKALAAGLFLAIGVGGGYAWYRSAALENIWQRGVIAVLGAVGALLAGFLAAPIYGLVGLPGLIIWVILDIAVGFAAMRWAVGGTGEEGSGTGTA